MFEYFNNLAGQAARFDYLIIFCAEYLAYVLVALFLAILIFSKKTYREKIIFFIFIGLSVFISRVVVTEAIRYFYHVSRPFVNNNVHQLIFHETSSSFPSGHAAFFFALAMAVYLFSQGPTSGNSRGRSLVSVMFFVGAILIGIARVIAGVHWPLDILAGAAVGILSAIIVRQFAKIT